MISLLLLLPFTLAYAAAWPDAAFCDALRDQTRRMFDASNLIDATPLDHGLWLGNVCAATDHAFLASYNVSRVINMAIEWRDHCDRALCAARNDCDVVRECFALDDHSMLDPVATRALIEAAAARVTALREQGHSVLVHCNMGVSRSTAVVLRHLMDREPTLMYSEALARVQRMRAIAQPNALFESLLDTVDERKRRWKAKFEL